jgi:hypothetical protein
MSSWKTSVVSTLSSLSQSRGRSDMSFALARFEVLDAIRLAADLANRSSTVRTYSSLRLSFLRQRACIFNIVVSTVFHLLSAKYEAMRPKYIAAAAKSPSSLCCCELLHHMRGRGTSLQPESSQVSQDTLCRFSLTRSYVVLDDEVTQRLG